MSQQESQLHPTRSAPLCCDCKHFNAGKHVWPNVEPTCNHPSTPRDPVSGEAMTPPAHMRAVDQACGALGVLFTPIGSAAEVGGHEAAADRLQAGADLTQPPCHLVAQSTGELLGSAGADEGSNQLGVLCGESLAESSVD